MYRKGSVQVFQGWCVINFVHSPMGLWAFHLPPSLPSGDWSPGTYTQFRHFYAVLGVWVSRLRLKVRPYPKLPLPFRHPGLA